MTTQEKLDFAEKNLECLLEWVSRFDFKSSVVLSIDTGMLGVLASFAPPLRLWTLVMIIFGILSLIALGLSFLFIYFGNYPQTKGPSKSLLYFGSIAKNSGLEYQQAFLRRNVEEHLNDILEQSHRNSEILEKKFMCLKWAYRILIASLFPWAITIFLFRSIPLTS